MANIDDRRLALGRVYARAMHGVAAELGEEQTLGEELAALGKAISEVPDFAIFADSPLVGGSDRGTSVENTFRGRVSDLLADSLAVIATKGRLAFLPAIIEAYRQELRERSGVIDAEVVSAVDLSEEMRVALQEAIYKHTGKKAQFTEQVDPTILGGLIVRTAGEKIDTSVATQLRTMSENLSKRASEELIQGTTFTEAATDAAE